MSKKLYISGYHKKFDSPDIIIKNIYGGNSYSLWDSITGICINDGYPDLESANQAADMYWFSKVNGWTCD